jgi:hypothetical protein
MSDRVGTPRNATKPKSVVTVDIKDTGVVRTKFSNVKEKSNATRSFIGWDGEACIDAGYCLLGASSGERLRGKYLSTTAMLDFILETGNKHKRAFHVAFAFDYDVNNILKDVPWTTLIMLKERGRAKWREYHLEHIPGKVFCVRKNGVRGVRIEDIFSYFRSPYCTASAENPGALDKYNIGSLAERVAIASDKSRRGDFQWKDIEKINHYMGLELQCMPPLMDKIREACNAAGMYIGQWYGPGALAKYELYKHGINRHMSESPPNMSLAVRTAYAGGWFERFQAGMYLGPVYTADLNSAYAWAMTQMPSLSSGEWHHVRGERARDYARAGQFGVYRIRFGTDTARAFADYMGSSRGNPLPLFQRSGNGNISRPVRTDGWWWTYEASQVMRLSNCDFLEAWVFDDNGERPFEWVEDMYNMRLILQQAGDPAQLALKWALASMYGTLAQRAGWDRKLRSAPRWHQLEWAGAITSVCRSLILSAAASVARNGGLVSIDTDGIISTQSFSHLPHGEGDRLGQWKVEEYSGIIYIQNGIYWLRDMSGNWQPPKTRGIPRSQIADVEIAMDALRAGGKFKLTRHNFVGYGASIHRKDRSIWRTWVDSDYEIDLNYTGSRQHVKKMCRACNKGQTLLESLHDLTMVPPKDSESAPHKLPWLEDNDDAALVERLRHEMELHEINMEFA